jgi:hypothetical protein
MTNTTKNAKATETHACACGGVTFTNFGEDTKTVCTATTKRTFAPGHDARLKGELIRRGLAGDVVRMPSGEVVSCEYIASLFGFGHMVADGIRRGIEKAQAKATKKAAKTAERKLAEGAGLVANKSEDEAAKADALVVKAKVGRWEYFGVILAAGDGQPVFRYTDKKGNTQDTMKFVQI